MERHYKATWGVSRSPGGNAERVHAVFKWEAAQLSFNFRKISSYCVGNELEGTNLEKGKLLSEEDAALMQENKMMAV